METESINYNNDLSLSEQAYIGLRDLLRQGAFRPGQRISEQEICERFTMSRTPVREAIRRLQSEGLLDPTPGGRAVVAEIDLDRVEEIYDMRESVEGLAARLAARNARSSDLIRLELILQEQRADIADETEFLKINDRFHGAIYELSMNRYVIQSGESLMNSASMIRGTTHGAYDYASWSLEDHQAIFAAICNGDTTLAEAEMRKHVRRGRWQRIRLLTAQHDKDS